MGHRTPGDIDPKDTDSFWSNIFKARADDEDLPSYNLSPAAHPVISENTIWAPISIDEMNKHLP